MSDEEGFIYEDDARLRGDCVEFALRLPDVAMGDTSKLIKTAKQIEKYIRGDK